MLTVTKCWGSRKGGQPGCGGDTKVSPRVLLGELPVWISQDILAGDRKPTQSSLKQKRVVGGFRPIQLGCSRHDGFRYSLILGSNSAIRKLSTSL